MITFIKLPCSLNGVVAQDQIINVHQIVRIDEKENKVDIIMTNNDVLTIDKKSYQFLVQAALNGNLFDYTNN